MSNTALFTNNASTVLAEAVSTTSQTTITVASGTGDLLLPSPGSWQFFSITLTKLSAPNGPPWEIAYCTGRTGDVLTVLRGQEGTTATTWDVGDNVQLLLTAGVLTGFSQSSQINPNIQSFTTSGTFTVPAGVTQVEVTTIGGGGAGGSGNSTLPGGGGGSGGVGVAIITGLTPGASIPIVVGSGGAPASAGNTGGNGGTSSFGSGPSIEATGGYGGEGGLSGSGGGVPGGAAGFSGSAGYGNYGSYGSGGNPSNGQGGTGGGPGNGLGYFGSGVNGLAALGYGGGGGGGSAGGSGSTGGAGGGGIVIVKWYVPA